MVARDSLIAAGLTALVITAIVVAALVYFAYRIETKGVIKAIGLEVYADENCTVGVQSIDWGTLSPGGYAEVTLYLKITSNVPSNLTLVTENFNPPEAENFLTLTWNYDGSILDPGQVISVAFKLSVAESVTGITDFSFDIVLTAVG